MANYVIGDWGSSNLRLWLTAAGQIVGRRDGPGISLCPDPGAVLAKALDGWEYNGITLCGMAGSRDGLHEVTYAPSPVSLGEWARLSPVLSFGGKPLRIASGVCCRNESGLPDVMRGEETQIFGAMALSPHLASGTQQILLPGTHSKWVNCKDGKIGSFRTFMTGELFARLDGSSLFGATVAGDALDEQGFTEGLDRAREGHPLHTALFAARTRQLCDGKTPGWAKAYVSGLLIGSEIAAMAKDSAITIIGERSLAQRYAEALAHFGADASIADGEECVIAGLRLIHADD